MFKIKGTKSQGCCYCHMFKLVNDPNNVIGNGLGSNGYIIQLFKIFKNNDIFCIKEQKQEICGIYINVKLYDMEYHNLIISINKGYVMFKSIDQILNYQLVMEGMGQYDNCNLGSNYRT